MLATGAVVAVTTACVILRPGVPGLGRVPEAAWAVLGALLLVLTGLLPLRDALHAVGRSTGVCLFLFGTMLLAEVARREGLFDWLAAHAVRRAQGSARRLLVLNYGVGVAVTALLSNDATAVVLTPAVLAAVRVAGAAPLPHLLGCALVANAASFVLPISNPANLVLYPAHMPPLPVWLERFLLPSALSIGATLGVLVLLERASLRQAIRWDIDRPTLSPGGRIAAAGIGVTALLLLGVSTAGFPLGGPTALAGVGTAATAMLRHRRETPWAVLRGPSPSVLPLVAALFVLVAGLDHAGVMPRLAVLLHRAADRSVTGTAVVGAVLLAIGCNLANNLPAGLVAGAAVATAHPPPPVADALVMAIDLGPNLSVTGSLATILWLAALRREGIEVGFGTFLARGAVAMPMALSLALAARLLT